MPAMSKLQCSIVWIVPYRLAAIDFDFIWLLPNPQNIVEHIGNSVDHYFCSKPVNPMDRVV